MKPTQKIFTWLPIIGALAVFLLCAFALNQNIGLANNGDFYRVMKVNRLSFLDETDQAWRYQHDYRMELDGQGFFPQLASTWSTAQKELYDSPQFALVKIAKSVCFVYNCVVNAPRDVFHMEALCGIYLLLYAFAAWSIIRFFQSWRTRLATICLLLFLYCDMGYLLYFHSFYGEALQFVCVMILIGCLLHLLKAPSKKWFLLLIISSYFLAGSKLVNIPYALCFVFVGAILMRKKRMAWLISASACVFILLLFGSIPDWMNHDTTYQSVFFGILKESPSPQQDLEELGLPSEYISLQNTHAYLKEYPIDITSQTFQQQFFDQIGKGDILRFYAKHPIRLIQKLSTAISYSGSIRPPSLANSGTARMGITDRYSLWSHLRLQTKFLYHPCFVWPILLGLALGAIVWIIRCIRTKELSHPLLLYLLLVAGLYANLLLPILGNGEADLAKHLFFMIHLMDIALGAGILWLVSQWPKWRAILPSAGLVLLALLFAFWPTEVETRSFGGYEWTVISQTEYTQTLVCNQTVAHLPFDSSDTYGDNLWVTSQLRAWLNESFLQEEQEQLLPMTYQVCLSDPNRALAQGGFHPLIWTHDSNTVASLFQDSWRMTVTDRVALLTVQQVQSGGFKRALGQEYWLVDPYGNNGSMVRYMDRFGQVLHRDASQATGVRPVITIYK